MNPKRILVIDDDEALTQMVKLNLEAKGQYEVRIVNHSVHAIAAAHKFQPDLILLDYIMPGMDGGDVTASLQQDPLLRSIPIIMVTALVSNKEMRPEGTVHCGGQVMLAKPVRMENLLKCIEQQLLTAA
jgi:CheY-like chemotaxis protein